MLQMFGTVTELADIISGVPIPVSSEAIEALQFDPVVNALRVHFRNGSVYRYPGVSEGEVVDFLEAPSLGQHFLRYFKDREAEREF